MANGQALAAGGAGPDAADAAVPRVVAVVNSLSQTAASSHLYCILALKVVLLASNTDLVIQVCASACWFTLQTKTAALAGTSSIELLCTLSLGKLTGQIH